MMGLMTEGINKKIIGSILRTGAITALYLICVISLFSRAFSGLMIIDALISVVAAILALYVILSIKKLDIVDSLFILSGFIIILITYLNNSLSLGIVAGSLTNSLFPVFIRAHLKKDNYILTPLYYIAFVAIVITFISMFFPGVGIDDHQRYFVGEKNALAIALIPAALVVVLYSKLMYGKLNIRSKVLLLLAAASIIIGGSSTGVVAALLLIIYIFIGDKFKFGKILLILFPLVQLLFFNTTYVVSQPLFADFITNVLGKSLTFTARTDVWEVSMQGITESVIFGHGRNNGIVNATFPELSESHNLLLEILITGGSILFAIILLLIICVLIKKFQFKIGKNIQNMSLYFLFIMLVIGLMESILFQTGFWFVLAIATASGDVARNRQINAEKRKV